MQKVFEFLMLGSVCVLLGCNEVIKTDEHVTVIDVVGEPSDPTSDASAEADILGAANAVTDDSDSVTDAKPASNENAPVLQSQPVPVRTAKQSPDISKQ